MTKKLHKELTEWQDFTFPTATPASCIAHLREELEELDESMDSLYNFDIDEWADCYMLLIGVANTGRFSFEDCKAAIKYKLEENRKRKWGDPNEQGYVKHVPLEESSIKVEMRIPTDEDFCNAYGYTAEMLTPKKRLLGHIFVVKNHILGEIEYRRFFQPFADLVYGYNYYPGLDILRVFKIYQTK